MKEYLNFVTHFWGRSGKFYQYSILSVELVPVVPVLPRAGLTVDSLSEHCVWSLHSEERKQGMQLLLPKLLEEIR